MAERHKVEIRYPDGDDGRVFAECKTCCSGFSSSIESKVEDWAYEHESWARDK